MSQTTPATDRLPDRHTPASNAGQSRLPALDIVRGFALCGILVANVPPIAAAGAPVVAGAADPGPSDLGVDLIGLFVNERFFVIFSLLFGIGFALLFESAADRVARPRVVLLRRLLALLGIGLAHFLLLWPGDILMAYAVVGLVVLLPASWLPRWATAVLANLLLLTPLALGGMHLVLVPGLFLLGATLTRYGLVRRMGTSSLGPAGLTVLFGAGAVPLLVAQDGVGDPLHTTAGLLLAGAYVCALLVLLRTPLYPVLRAVFQPLGRMALTNYLTASLLVRVAASGIDGPPHRWSSTTVLLVAAGVLALQWLWSTLWLRRCRQGPLEWLWRWVTWARRPPLRRIGSR
ncbi:DUF418 domain-containing protein [Micromonospora sp. WMMD1102]|uniref:DUF418 domain-containing protein n=1 Tax=Micromonospora sp. WMMD1102 TaxID=3016105 RepID=UPI002414D7F1|nr:DUF418 domain-containing protein [Micromonospora sp. WMMD1102]MDG4791360.1 DUF418 domain-containing protein [Micromonospora sp. WMMD1102]